MKNATYTYDTDTCLLEKDDVPLDIPTEIKEVSRNFGSSFEKVNASMDESRIENPDEKLNDIFS